jgi:hypothetical protein
MLVTTGHDRLFTEIDRQLADVRATADGLATRAGLLISASALAAGLLGTRLPMLKTGLAVVALIALGTASVFGAVVLVPGLKVGPDVSTLSGWFGEAETPTIKALYGAKLLALEGNRRRLAVMRTLFYAQGAFVVVAITVAIAAASGR